VKGFFNDAVPSARSVLVIESGSQHILSRALPQMCTAFPEARLDLLTCWPGAAHSAPIQVRQASDFPGNAAKLRLLSSYRNRPPDVLAVVCSKEPIMYSWKMMALLLVPAKTLIINENGDFFWLDWNNRRTLRSFLQSRWVIIRKEFLLTALRTLVFPLTVLYLLATATWIYARRWRRLLWWRITGPPQTRTRIRGGAPS
jgi:hypothetical protein